MLRTASPLSEDLERLAQEPGLLESIYPRAVPIELERRGISFEVEKSVPVKYQGSLLCRHRLDMFMIHVAQVISYLRLMNVRLGLLVNFNVPLLKHGIRRVIL